MLKTPTVAGEADVVASHDLRERSGGVVGTGNVDIERAQLSEEATALTEDQMGLDKGQRRDVQRRLNGLGFDTKVTGSFNEETRSAIKRWQATRGFPVSGYLSQKQRAAMLSEIVNPPSSFANDQGSTDGNRRPVGKKGGGASEVFGGMSRSGFPR